MAKGVKFRDAVQQYDALRRDIAARRFAPVYLLMGEEGYFIDRLCDLLATTVLTEAEQAFNQIVVYGKDTDEDTIINLARQLPMMGSYEVIIVKEAAQLDKIDRLSLYTASPSPSTILVVCYKGKAVDKRSAFYKHVAAKGVVFEAVHPYDNELPEWAGKYIADAGYSIDRKALSMLVDNIGTDLTKLTKELDKLSTAMPEGAKTITAETVEANIGLSKDFNVFELLKAIGQRDERKAFTIADYFARNPRSSSLPGTISSMFDYFLKLFTVNYKRWQERFQGLRMPQDRELAEMLSVHPFFLEEYKQAATLFPNNKIFLIFGFLREYDLKNKGLNGGSATDGELLKELLLKIFMV